jgi:hypothetical protein
MDGDTSATSTTIADADRVVLNDGGVMVQVAVTDLKTYIGVGGSLSQVTESSKTGSRLSTATAANYGNIGTKAVDLSYSGSSSSTKGATGDYSFAMGEEVTASGSRAVAIGEFAEATGNTSVALGYVAKATGSRAFATGENTTASGNFSAVMGQNTTASGTYSIATGYSTEANGTASFSMGKETEASDFGSLVIGTYNSVGNAVTTDGSASAFDVDNSAFVIGNGASGSLSDAFVVYSNGNATLSGDLSIGGSNKELRFYEGANYVGFEAPALTANQIWVLPIADGSANQVLKTNGSGTLDWATVSGGASALDGLSDAKLAGADFTGGLSIGHNMTAATLNAAQYNTAIGATALDALTSGDYNVAVGYDALSAISTGNKNTAVGYAAGSLGSSHNHYNASLGYEAGQNTGNSNVAVGYFAGKWMGAANVAVGFNALTSGGGGSSVGVGYAALSNNQGSSNIAIGYNSLTTNSTGTRNNAIGTSSGKLVTDGVDNNIFGYRAMYVMTSGDRNISIGNDSSYALSDGNDNLVIGYQAGYEITTGDNNLVIGNNAGRSTANGGLGEITTADNIISLGNNTHTSSVIKVDWTVTSDKRDKTDFKNIPYGLDFLNKLNPLSYKFRVDRSSQETSGPERYGFLAQEILELEGENPVIINNDDKENLKYNQSSLVPVLVKAVQEQQEMIDSLKKTIEDQNKRFEKIESLLLKKE